MTTTIAAGPPPRPDHPDWRHGYNKPLEEMVEQLGPDWLVSELRLRCSQLETAERERLAERHRAQDREAALRHRLAHEIHNRLWSLKLGVHATKGAKAVLDLVHPISRCPDGCDGQAVRPTDAPAGRGPRPVETVKIPGVTT